RRHLLHPELLLRPRSRGLRHALAIRGVLREEGDPELVRLRVEARREVLDDELDVVPAEPGGVDLGAEDGLEAALVEPRIDAGALPVDDVVARRRFARRTGGPAPRR